MTPPPPPADGPDLPSVRGKVALVVGASRGIGAAAVRLFAVRGAKVVAASRDLDALTRLCESVRMAGGEATAVRADISDAASVERLGARVASEFGRLDCAFNNAGDGYRPTPLAEVRPVEFDRVQRVTVLGTFLLLRQEIPLMIASGGGTIVNMASTAGVGAFLGGAPYIAAKHAILGLTKSAAMDYAQQGVRVNAVAPGPIETDRIRALPEEAKEPIRRAVPMRRIGRPEEVAETVLWLSGDGSRFVTGATIFVDGGRTAGIA